MDTHLVLICHGSRDPRWRKPFQDLEKSFKDDFGDDKVSLCYMEFAEPNLNQVVQAAIEKGFKKFKVLPLFMAGGGHVDMDIPKQVDSAKSLGDIEIEILKPIGEQKEVVEAMKEVVRNL